MNKVTIESVVENNNFHVFIENCIKLKLPRTNRTSCRGAEYYEVVHIEQFIENIKNNVDGSLQLYDMKVILDMLHIQFISEECTIKLANTEQHREYLVVLFDKFMEYLSDLI